MKIEITKGNSPLADLFARNPSVEGETDYQKLMFVEELLGLLQQQGFSRTELARRMKIQPSRVTSMLSGTNNFTIETMVRAARAVNATLHQKLVPAGQKARWQCWEEKNVHPSFLHAESTARKQSTVTFKLPEVSYDDNRTAA